MSHSLKVPNACLQSLPSFGANEEKQDEGGKKGDGFGRG